VKNNSGIILLEVIITVAIISMGLVVIAQSFLSVSGALARDLEYARAGFLLDEQWQTAKQYVPFLFQERAAGSQDKTSSSYYGEIAVGACPAEKNLCDVRISIAWNSGSQKKSIFLDTYKKFEEDMIEK